MKIFSIGSVLLLLASGVMLAQEIQFEEVTHTVFPASPTGADFDLDGRLDVFGGGENGAMRLFKNISRAQRHWFSALLVGKRSNRNGFGAQVSVHANGEVLRQYATAASGGYGSVANRAVRLGLHDNARLDSIVVAWPSGEIGRFYQKLASRHMVFREGESETAAVFNGQFVDISSAAGIGGISEHGGHGILFADVNGDRREDLYVTHTNFVPGSQSDFLVLPDELFINNGNNTFTERAAQAGVDDPGQSHGAVWVDVDNDGDFDLFNGQRGPSGNRLYRNNGNGDFTEMTAPAGILLSDRRTISVLGLDIENDGDMDLFSGNWGLSNEMYVNDGAGHFTNENRGVFDLEPDAAGTMAATAADVDHDGDLDIFLAKREDACRLYINNGSGNFTDEAAARGVAFNGITNGAVFFDMDRDADLDLLLAVSSFNGSRNGELTKLRVYRNRGDGNFDDETDAQNITFEGYTLSTGDVDNDGDEDFLQSINFGMSSLWLNDGAGHFTQQSNTGLERNGVDARAATFGDIDNDGDLDVAITYIEEPTFLYRNDLNVPGSGAKNYLQIAATSSSGSAGGWGTKFYLYEAGHLDQPTFLRGYRQTTSAQGTFSGNSPVVHFGVDPNKTYDLRVHYLGGKSRALTGLAPGQRLELNAGNDLTPPVSGQIVHEETRTGGSTSSRTVATSASLTAASGQLYLAAISTKPRVAVSNISGLGLTWILVKSQCSGRNQTGVEVWRAQGTPSGIGTVTATLAAAANNAAIAVSRYSGVATTNAVGNVTSGNTAGVNGSCSSGSDNNTYAFNLTASANGAMAYGAASMRQRTHTPGAGYTERGEIIQGASSAGSATSVAVQDKSVASPSTVIVNGTLGGSVDWAVVALEIKPQPGGGGATQHSLAVNTVGSGSVALNPPGGVYGASTVVTLTANPASGWQFNGWSGDVTGSNNPATITMNANKNVTATFTQLPATQYTLAATTVGSGSVNLSPAGGVYDAGTVVTLTATPASGWQFSGWSGDLTGSNNPATITMNANKNVTATFTTSGSSGQVVHEETRTGGSTSLGTVATSASLTAASGQLYLAAISTKPKIAVNHVSGLGLTWTLVKSQCSGRNQTGIEVWRAQGTPNGNGAVTATLAVAANNAAIAVSRYSGVATTNAVGNVTSGNTAGVNGSCSSGADNNTYAFNLTVSANGAMAYGAASMRQRTHTPGAGYTERGEIIQGASSAGSASSVAVQDKIVASPSTVIVNGTFSSSVDWAVVALEIKSETGMAKPNSTVENTAPAPPAEFQLEQNYSNPFNPSTVISFELPVVSQVTLQIYNKIGQLVCTLVEGEMEMGRHAVNWNGRNRSGNTVAAGIYLYRIVAQDQDGKAVFMQTRRMTLVK